MNTQNIKILIGGLLLGLLGGFASHLLIKTVHEPSESDLIKQYYSAAAATLESPHHIRKALDVNEIDFILVDVRTEEEYNEEHIVGAVNIDASLPREIIIQRYKDLELEHPDLEIVIYCYSSACLTGRKIGNMLAQNGVFVHEMSIGWNEWRYDFNSWNYPNEWDKLDSSRYVVSGKEPGILVPAVGEVPPPCRIDGEFGC